MCIDRSRITEIVIVPDIIQNLFSGKCNFFVFHKVGEQLEFLVAQIHRFSVDCHLVGVLVHADSVRLQDLAGRHSVSTAQDRLDPCNKNLRAERF